MSRTPGLDNLTTEQAAKIRRVYGRATTVLAVTEILITLAFPVALIVWWRPAWPQTVGIVLLWVAVGFMASVANDGVRIIDGKTAAGVFRDSA